MAVFKRWQKVTTISKKLIKNGFNCVKLKISSLNTIVINELQRCISLHKNEGKQMTEQEEYDLYIESLHNPEDAAGLRKIVKTRTALQLLLTIDEYKEMITRDRQFHIDYDSGCQYIMSTDPEIVKTLQPSETHKLLIIEDDKGFVTVIYDNHFKYTVDFYGNIGYRLSKLMKTAEGDKQAIDECFDDEDGLDDYEVEYYAKEAAHAAQ